MAPDTAIRPLTDEEMFGGGEILDDLTEATIKTEGLIPGQTPLRITNPTMRNWGTIQGVPIDKEANVPHERRNFFFVEPGREGEVIKSQWRNYFKNPTRYGMPEDATVEDAIRKFDQENPQNKIEFLRNKGIDIHKRLKDFDISMLNPFRVGEARAGELRPLTDEEMDAEPSFMDKARSVSAKAGELGRKIYPYTPQGIAAKVAGAPFQALSKGLGTAGVALQERKIPEKHYNLSDLWMKYRESLPEELRPEAKSPEWLKKMFPPEAMAQKWDEAMQIALTGPIIEQVLRAPLAAKRKIITETLKEVGKKADLAEKGGIVVPEEVIQRAAERTTIPRSLRAYRKAKGLPETPKPPTVKPTLPGFEAPRAGGIPHKIPANLLKKGIDVISREAPIRMTSDMTVKDVAGNKVTLPKGEEYTPYKLSNNQIWLHDGKNVVVNKNQLENVKGKGLELGERKAVGEDVWKGEKATTAFNEYNRYAESLVSKYSQQYPGYNLNNLFQEGILTNQEKARLNELDNQVRTHRAVATKFSQWQVPGGKNYREVVVTAPEKYLGEITKDKQQSYGKDVWWYDSGNKSITVQPGMSEAEVRSKLASKDAYKSSHWDEPNPLYHLRMNDRVVDGKKTLFIEEMQSDWAREGREKGFGIDRPHEKATQFPNGTWRVEIGDMSGTVNVAYDTAEEAIAEFKKGYPEFKNIAKGIPYHPALKNWIDNAVNKALDIAVREGYDKIAWTTGEQQADRYDLSKQVDSIKSKIYPQQGDAREVEINAKDDTYINLSVKPDGTIQHSTQSKFQNKKLDEVVGKDIAKKILESKDVSLSGEDLKVGGEWAKNLYDRMIPQAFEKVVKKAGGKVGRVDLGVLKPSDYTIRQITSGEWAIFTKAESDLVTSFKTKKEAENYIGATTQPSLTITPQIREMVLGAPKAGAKPVEKPVEAPKEVTPTEDPVIKITKVLREAKPIRRQQETLYRKERGKRLAESLKVGLKGERGFYAELGKLKGELPKAQFESIRSKISQTDIDSLFIRIKDSPLLSDWNKIAARQGLSKLFGEFGGKVPTESELILLKKVLGSDFVKVVKDKRGLWQKLKEAALQLYNIPKSLMASYDLSAVMRQGVFFIGRPKQFFPAFGRMFGAFGSEKAFKAIQDDIASKPSYDLMQDARLSLTEMDDTLSKREEAFLSSWAEKIPIIGKGVRASGRAYVGFLNKLRADVFDDLVKMAERQGLKPYENMDLAKGIAQFVNNGTGRGRLGRFENSAVALNTIFFSPRLMSARLTLLNPIYYIKQEPFVRKEALKSLFSFTAFVLSVLGMAKMMGFKVGIDPRSSDFGKIKIGNTRIDILGGFQQYIRMAGQLITGKYVSSVTGKELTLGEGYKPLTRADIIQRQLESKFSPPLSFANTWLKGQTFEGKKLNIPKEIGLRFVPMVIQDIYDLMQDNPDLVPLGALGIFGVGIQTYKQIRKPKKGAVGFQRLIGKKPKKGKVGFQKLLK